MKKPKIEPIGKVIFVKQDPEASRITDSGLVKPSSVEQEKPSIGEVLAVGKSVKHIKIGDRVVYGRYAGQEISIHGVDYVLLYAGEEDTDVLAFDRG